ncbi:MAG TPA: response regulator transcription factor [Candidatus Binatia bacterium]|jgi:two-component system KDP operon response regulator KdpE|nr:response regulator transcription factor [Candidatus Binatia bacterium]
MSASRTTVLVVDDELPLRDFIRRNLEVRHFEVLTAANGLEGLALFGTEQVDLVIADLMMPHMNGLEMIRRIRQQSLLPIIVLSALGEEQDKVQALNQGADDYLTKPFGVGELLARIQAVLRRTQWTRPSSQEASRLVCEELVLDRERHQAMLRGKRLELTPTEFELLALLMSQAGKVLPHKLILQRVWGPEYGQETEYLRVYIGRLRQKIEPDPGNPRYLRTERGIGYSFHRP